MAKSNITCDMCKKVYTVDRTEEIPPGVTELFCNWAPCCEDYADDYYNERHSFEPLPIERDPNQLSLL